jgi:NhaP-type Na+/H+ or K+/H+ antiporter
MDDLLLKIALIGAAGITAQWVAWRFHLPAIVLLLVAGFVAGPVTGFLDPARDFGDIYRPVISLAVAIILFEGGLTLNFKDIRDTSTAVRRVILFSGPIVWSLTALAAHYVGGLSWPAAIVLGAVLIVTGPTVVMPLLRQAHLKQRPASILRWEAIINDAVGALCAVLAFEAWLVIHGSHEIDNLLAHVAVAALIAVGGGYLAARLIIWAFIRGHVPEYLKAPVLLATVLTTYALTNLALEEAGLVTVTVMGIVIANSRIASLTELRRFKETITVLLVSALFIMLTAALDLATLQALDWRALLFVVLVMFVIRPIAIMISTIGSGLLMKERLLVSWIAPRGIVAVAVTGLFGSALLDTGVEDASRMLAFTFAVVVATILAHGFSLGPLARMLDLKSTTRPGILIVGGSAWSTALAKKLKELNVPVLVSDNNWNALREARLAEIPVYFGEVLSEEAHHKLDLGRFSTLIAATNNDAYNALVCTDFGPELGRSHVFEIAGTREPNERQSLNFTLGGRPLVKPPMSFPDLRKAIWDGWVFQTTRLTAEYGFDQYAAARHEDTRTMLWVQPSGKLVFYNERADFKPQKDDIILSFGPARSGKTGTRREGSEAPTPVAVDSASDQPA